MIIPLNLIAEPAKYYAYDTDWLGMNIFTYLEVLPIFCFDSLSCFSFQFINIGSLESRTVFVRRCLCYLMTDRAEEALKDSMNALGLHHVWPTAFYLQAAALKFLGMDNDAQEILKEGASLEAMKIKNAPSV